MIAVKGPLKYAILSSLKDGFLNDLGSGYIREFLKIGAVFIDYEEEYLRHGNRKVQEVIQKTLEENATEVLIYQASPSDFHFSLEFFQKLREKVFTVMTLGDSDHYFDIRDIYYAQCMDLVVVYDCLTRHRFRQYGVDAISFYSSFDSDIYKRRALSQKTMDVSFIGDTSNKMERRRYIDHMAERGMPVEVFGTGSGNGQVTLERMVEIFNSTKINLNFTGISLKNAIRREPNINLRLRQIKGRLSEIALCGGFVLTEYVPGIEEVFEVDNEIVTFDSREELFDKASYYLKNDAERERIANNGYERALKEYSLKAAVPMLISRIEEIKKNSGKKTERDVFVDSVFVKNYVTFRVELISRLLRAGKWALVPEELLLILKNRKINLKKAAGISIFSLFPPLKKIYLRLL